MSDGFDPYYKWLAIRDKHRPLNHYRLLGLELFEEDADVITAAADQRIAHVRTYQLGQHSALSQRILNELVVAKICLLDPKDRADYDRRLRERSAEPIAQAPSPVPVAASGAAEAVKPTATNRSNVGYELVQAVEPVPPERQTLNAVSEPAALPPNRRRSRTPRHRPTIAWPIAAAAGLVVATGLIVAMFLMRRDHDNAALSHFVPETPDGPSSLSTDQELIPFEATPAFMADDSAASNGLTDRVSEKSSSPPDSAEIVESFRPTSSKNRFADLPSELPKRLRSSWESSGPAKIESDVMLCHEIAQLAQANLAVAALLQRSSKKELDDVITRAVATIDEFNLFEGRPFAELISSSAVTPAAMLKSGGKTSSGAIGSDRTANRSWQDVDRCFDVYASGINRLRLLIQENASRVESSEKVTQHVEQTESLFRAVSDYVRSNLASQGATDQQVVQRLKAIESAAAIDSYAADSALQQICHWTLRICQTLGVYCEVARAEHADRLKSITQQVYGQDFGSGLTQLRSLLLLELHMWAMLAERDT